MASVSDLKLGGGGVGAFVVSLLARRFADLTPSQEATDVASLVRFTFGASVIRDGKRSEYLLVAVGAGWGGGTKGCIGRRALPTRCGNANGGIMVTNDFFVRTPSTHSTPVSGNFA